MNKPYTIFNKVDLPEESAQLFYEVSLSKKQVRIYNQAGKLRILKPIKLPPNCLDLDWNTAQMYIICRLQNKLQIYNVLDCQAPVSVCEWKGSVITYVHYDFKANLIFIVDSFHTVYYLEARREATCQVLFKAYGKINCMGVSEKGTITLYYPIKKQAQILKVNWDTMEVSVERTQQNVNAIYVNAFWNVIIYSPQPNCKEATGFVDINDRKFSHSVKPDGEFVISSKPRTLLFIDLKYNTMNIIDDDVQTLYTFEQALPPLKQNHFAFVAKQDVQFKVSLMIQEYRKGQFFTHAFEIIRIQGKQIDIELSANIRNVLKPNGRINIHFERKVREWMQKQYRIKRDEKIQQAHSQRRHNQSHEQENAQQMIMNAIISQNVEQLSCQFFIYLLRQKTQWVHQVSAMIKGSFDKFFLEMESFMFVEYCEYGLMVSIKKQLQELLKNHRDQRWNILLQCSEKQIVAQCKNTYYFLQKFTKLMKQQLQADSRSTSDKYERACRVMEMSRSFILITNILYKEDISGRFANMVNAFALQKKKLEVRYNEESQWKRNRFRPLLCHQYFKGKGYLSQASRELPQFLDYLISISGNYYEVAYFFFFLIRSQIPFSHPEITQFYEDIVNIQPLPEPQFIRKTAKKVAGMMMATPAVSSIPFIQYLCQTMIICKHPGWSAFLIEFELYQNLLTKKYKSQNLDAAAQQQINFALFCLLYSDQTKNAYAFLKRIFKNQLKRTNSFQRFIDYCLINNRLNDLLLEVKYEDKDEKIAIKNYLSTKLKGQSSQYEQILMDFVEIY